MFFNHHLDYHVFNSQLLYFIEWSFYTCLLQLMNFNFSWDQSEYCNIIRLEILHTHWICSFRFELFRWSIIGLSRCLLIQIFGWTSLFHRFWLSTIMKQLSIMINFILVLFANPNLICCLLRSFIIFYGNLFASFSREHIPCLLIGTGNTFIMSLLGSWRDDDLFVAAFLVKVITLHN